MNTQGAPSGDESTSEPRSADVAPGAEERKPDAGTPDADGSASHGSPSDGSIPDGSIWDGSVWDGSVPDGSASEAAQQEPTALRPGDESTLPRRTGRTHPYASHATEPIFVAPPMPRRRRNDWPILVFALVVSVIVMAGCCFAGFAFYVRNGGHFN
jgi:hypothetical protein